MDLMYFTGFFFLILFSLIKDKLSTSISFNKSFYILKMLYTLGVYLKSSKNTKQTEQKWADGAICLSKDFVPQPIFWKSYFYNMLYSI